MARPAAEIEPVWSISSSSRILPGPTRQPPGRSIRIDSRGAMGRGIGPCSAAERPRELVRERIEELPRGQPGLVRPDQQREVLGHPAALDRLDTDPLKGRGESLDLGRAVELAAIGQGAGPGEDRRDRVGRGLLALLMLTIMP